MTTCTQIAPDAASYNNQNKGDKQYMTADIVNTMISVRALRICTGGASNLVLVIASKQLFLRQ